MNKRIAPVAISMGVLLGLGGGFAVAAVSLRAPAPQNRQVQLVQPAAETVAPEPVTTTTEPAPSATATPSPVESTSEPAPEPVKTQEPVVPQPETTTPETPAVKPNVGKVVTNEDGSTSVQITPGQAPPPIPAKPAPSPSPSPSS